MAYPFAFATGFHRRKVPLEGILLVAFAGLKLVGQDGLGEVKQMVKFPLPPPAEKWYTRT